MHGAARRTCVWSKQQARAVPAVHAALCRYMTWWGFSLQIITLAVCFLDDILPPPTANTAARSAAAAVAAAAGERPPALQPEQAWGRGSKGSGRHGRPTLTVLADDLACMSFAFAHVVSIMYFAVNALTRVSRERSGEGMNGGGAPRLVSSPNWPATQPLAMLPQYFSTLTQNARYFRAARMGQATLGQRRDPGMDCLLLFRAARTKATCLCGRSG